MSLLPFVKHQRVVADLLLIIKNQLDECPNRCYVYPELDWIIDERTGVRSELIVVCKYVEEYIREPPEVVIEVVS